MRKALVVAAAAWGLIAWVDPKTAAPTVSQDAVAAEAQRQALYMLSARVKELRRVSDIAFRLQVANQDLCAERRPRLAFEVASAEDFPPAWRAAAAQALHLGSDVSVIHVAPASPALAAGVQAGDVLVSVNGQPVASGKKASETFRKRLAQILQAAPGAPLTLGVRRQDEVLTLTLTPVMACAYEVVVVDENDLNATADGKIVRINRPLLRLVESEEELALVIAHELAHNGQHHIQAQKKNARMAGLGGLLLDGLAAAGGVDTGGAFTKAAMRAGAQHASAEFEAEADYVGMYYLARAGYSTQGVENFWRKMAVEAPDSIFIKSSHPAYPERLLAIAAASEEIEAKRAKGEPLTPNQRER